MRPIPLRRFPDHLPLTGTLEGFLRTSTWGGVLTSAQIERVVSATTERSVEAGGFVARAGDEVRHWIGVVQGFVKMSVGSSEGKHSTLTGVPPGAWFGEGSLMKHERRRYDVVAVVDSKVAMFPAETFDWLRRTSIDFNHFLQDLMNARLSLFIGILAHDRLLDVDARVAHAIASLFDDALYGRPDHFLELTQDEIGLLANVSRQRANGALQALQAHGLIRLDRGGLHVLDVEALRRFADSTHPTAASTAAASAPTPAPTRTAFGRR